MAERHRERTSLRPHWEKLDPKNSSWLQNLPVLLTPDQVRLLRKEASLSSGLNSSWEVQDIKHFLAM